MRRGDLPSCQQVTGEHDCGPKAELAGHQFYRVDNIADQQKGGLPPVKFSLFPGQNKEKKNHCSQADDLLIYTHCFCHLDGTGDNQPSANEKPCKAGNAEYYEKIEIIASDNPVLRQQN